MRIVSGDEIETVLSFRDLIETLRRAYRSVTEVPNPGRFTIPRLEGRSGQLTVAPAWTNFIEQGHTDRGYIGCMVSMQLPSAEESPGSSHHSGVYLLLSGQQGQPIALFDGAKLAQWRWCAQRALAAHYLAREDSARLLFLGSIPCIEHLLQAYSEVRDIRSVLFLGDQSALCQRLSIQPAFKKIHFDTTNDAAGAFAGADIIACATTELLLDTELPAGVHIDILEDLDSLPSSLLDTPRLFAGDRHDSFASSLPDIAADLRELAQGSKAGRRYYGQITLFLSGDSTGLADLATAGHVFLRT